MLSLVPAFAAAIRRALPGTLGIFGAVLALSGCANYRLGTGSAPKFATLYVAPVRMDALVPQARVPLTTQIREAFIRDGRVRLVDSPAEADATLAIAISALERSVAVSRPDDTGRARRFDVTLQASATLTDNRTRQPYFSQRPLTATRGVFTDSGLVPAEYETMPLLAEILANQSVHAVLDTW